MPEIADNPANRRLIRLLGLLIFLAVISALFSVGWNYYFYWTPPGVVSIPDAPAVNVALNDHPRLISTERTFSGNQIEPWSPEYERLIQKSLELYDIYTVDPYEGDTIFPGYFALTYRLTGEQRYLDAAKDMVLNHCHFPKWNRKPESSNFYKIEMAYAVGMAYDLLYDEFSETERQMIEDNLSEVLDGLLWHLQGNPSKPFWYDAPHSNYYVAQHSAAGLLSICLGEKYPDWQRALNFAYDGLQPSIDLLEKDGGWIEGLTYQDFCWGQHGLLFLNALRVNDGPNRLEEEWFKTSTLFALHGILPGGEEQINFGDNSNDPTASWGYLLRAKPFFDGPFLDEFISRYHDNIDYPDFPLDAMLISTILEHDPTIIPQPFDEPAPCQYFPGIEWAVMRENWTDPESFFFATKAGYGGWDHNHVDQGTFILAFNGETYITDPGRGVFDERKETDVNLFYGGPYGHNVFIPGTGVDPLEWDEFTMYSENLPYRQSDAVIENWFDNIEMTSFRMDLSGAYPSESLTMWERSVEWVKPTELHNGYLIITDITDVPGVIRLVTQFPYDAGESEITGELGKVTITANPDDGFEIPGFSAVLIGPDGYSVIVMSKTEDEGLENVSIGFVAGNL